MTDPEITDDVRTMILRHLPTMDHVELLSVLRSGREEVFSRAQLATQMRKPEQLVDLCLESLAGAGMVAKLSGGEYRYSAHDERHDQTAEAVIKLYNERPVTLVRLLYDRPTAVATFADAFNLRKPR